MNIFTNEETAVSAQEAAVAFVQGETSLTGAIEPNTFLEAKMSFHIGSVDEITDSIQGKYLSTRLWELAADSTLTIQNVADIFEEGYGPIVSAEEGFLEYAGSVIPGSNMIFFYNVFGSAEQATAASAGAVEFVNGGELNGQIDPVVFTEGLISFDYTCVEGDVVTPGPSAGDDPGAGSEDSASSLTSFGILVMFATMALVL